MADTILKIPTYSANLDIGLQEDRIFETKAGKISLDQTGIPAIALNFNGDSTDSGGNNNNGIITGGVSYNVFDKIVGTAAISLGSGFVTCPLNGLPTTAMTEITFAFWAKPSGAYNTSIFIADPDDTNNRCSGHLPWSDGNIYWDFGNINTGNGRLSTAFNPAWYNQWAFWVFKSSPTGMTIKRNNVVIASSITSSTFTRGTKSLLLGYYPGFGTYWPGLMDAFRLYPRVTTDGQDTVLYNNGIGTEISVFYPTNSPSATLLKIGAGPGIKFKLSGSGLWIPENMGVLGTPQTPKYQYAKLASYNNAPVYNGAWFTQAQLRTAIGEHTDTIEAFMLKVQFPSNGSVACSIDDGSIPAEMMGIVGRSDALTRIGGVRRVYG